MENKNLKIRKPNKRYEYKYIYKTKQKKPYSKYFFTLNNTCVQ